jgi:hypothetical protein
VLRFPHQQGCKEKRVPLAQVRRLPFCLFSLVDVDGITTRVVRLLLFGQNFKALLLLQHHNNMLSSIIHALFWLIGFSFFFPLAKLVFRTRYNWWEPTMVAWWHSRWQRCIQILWRKWWFPAQGWVSCRLAWTSFLPGAICPAYQSSCCHLQSREWRSSLRMWHTKQCGSWIWRSSVVPSCVLHYEKLGCLIPCFVIGEAWLQPKKKKRGPVHGWELSENVWERGGGVVRANSVAIFRKCYHPDTQVILNLACINIYNNRFQNTLKRNPWKEKKNEVV